MVDRRMHSGAVGTQALERACGNTPTTISRSLPMVGMAECDGSAATARQFQTRENAAETGH